MKYLKIIFFIYCLINSIIFSQSITVTDMPLAIGNKWLYKIKLSGARPTTFQMVQSTITKDTIANGKQYFYCTNFWGENVNYFIRFNDSSKALVRYERNYCNGEIELLKLNPAPGDSNASCYQYPYYFNESIDTTLLGYPSVLNIYSKYSTNYYCVYTYIYRFFKNIGPYYRLNSSMCRIGYTAESYLIGAYVNGIVYGDTNYNQPGNVYRKNNLFPFDFNLSQNYPNPFNPVTKIKFELMQNNFTSLIIYDEAGKEISSLVNSYLNAGEYTFDWDASNYPSGIYFYILKAGNYSESKKMVLIK